MMKNMKSFGVFVHVLFFTCLLTILLGLSSCGTSGGGGGINAVFFGDYVFHQIGIDGVGTVYTSQVDITMNGNGTGDFTILRHSEGASGSGNLTYSVAQDSSFTVTNSSGTDTGLLSGDNSLFIMVDAESVASDTDGESMVGIGMRKDCLVPPVLSGIYRIGQIGVNTAGVADVIETKLVDSTITSAGNGTFTIIKDSGGAPGTGDFTYTIGADCAITVHNGTDNDFGIVSADGSRFVLVDADHADLDTEIVLAIGIQQAGNAGDSHFDGDYWLGEAGVDNAFGSSLYTAQIDLIAAGDGTATATPVAHSETATPGPSVPLTYTISNSDGTAIVSDGLTITDAMIDAAGELIFNVDTNPADGTIHLDMGLLQVDLKLWGST